ncbi:MAG: hypothetical protein QM674_15980 [Burkholderiaceae bacterium]
MRGHEWAGIAAQSLLSNRIPADSQGELQGVINSVVNLSAIIGPPLMTGLFAVAVTRAGTGFAGAPFVLGAALMIVATRPARRAVRTDSGSS